MELTLTRKIMLPSIAIPVIIATGIAVYFVNMPAWLLVERVEPSPDGNVIEIPESVLSDFPKLREALATADENYTPNLPGTTSMMTSFLEGREIQETLDSYRAGFSESNGSRLIVESEGKQYAFDIVFQYDSPSLA